MLYQSIAQKIRKQLQHKLEAESLQHQLKSTKISPSSTREGNGEFSIKKDYTLSLAVPASIIDNAQSFELKTYLVCQIARAAAIY